MTVADQLKIINNKINANQAQYDLESLAAKISAYSSGDLRKYKYLTVEDVGYKPIVVEQVKFDYSTFSKFLNKGLKEEDKEGPLKILKNIEDKNKNQLKPIEDQGKSNYTPLKILI